MILFVVLKEYHTNFNRFPSGITQEIIYSISQIKLSILDF